MSAEAQEARLDRLETRLDKLDAKLDELNERLAKQGGFVAGFASAFTLLASAVIGLAVYIWNHLR